MRNIKGQIEDGRLNLGEATDADMEEIAGETSITELRLQSPKFTPNALKHLANLTSIKMLDLMQFRIIVGEELKWLAKYGEK